MPNNYTLLTGNNKEILKTLDKNIVDVCITDPPYGMDIAGAKWDHNVPESDTWEEVKRVLKPGAFCLSFCSPQLYHRMAVGVEDAGFIVRDQIMWMTTTKMAKGGGLKPCHEPIVVAQKPISEKTIKVNIEKWGVGKINAETTRVPWSGKPPTGWVAGGHKRRHFGAQEKDQSKSTKGSVKVDGLAEANPNGRYPSNILGSVLPLHQEYFYDPIIDDENAYDNYYYSGRVTTKERGPGNNHPTPKPIKLMRYLIRLYCPKGGIVLDPFSGSGSTGIAALQEKDNYIGIELSQEYTDIAENRIQDFLNSQKPISKLFTYEK